MGTRQRLNPAVCISVVSNPLGWDGDPRSPSDHRRPHRVSNPLGWDGDRYATEIGSRFKLVSNPLGWDGDLRRKVADFQHDLFLIH